MDTISMTTNSFSMTAISYNDSEFQQKRIAYLNQLQDKIEPAMIAPTLFLSLLALIGLVGNSLVLFIYSRKFKRTSTRIIVMAIAWFDLIANIGATPSEIYELYNQWNFDNRPLCRSKRFLVAYVTLSSVMILLAVAVVRYRKICVPYGWLISVKQAKIICLFIALLSAVFSIPYVIINGRQTRQTPKPEFTGYECATDDSYKDTSIPVLVNIFYITIYLSCCVPLVVMYVRIGVQAWKHSKMYGISSEQMAAKNEQTSDSASTKETLDGSSNENGEYSAQSGRKESNTFVVNFEAYGKEDKRKENGSTEDVRKSVTFQLSTDIKNDGNNHNNAHDTAQGNVKAESAQEGNIDKVVEDNTDFREGTTFDGKGLPHNEAYEQSAKRESNKCHIHLIKSERKNSQGKGDNGEMPQSSTTNSNSDLNDVDIKGEGEECDRDNNDSIKELFPNTDLTLNVEETSDNSDKDEKDIDNDKNNAILCRLKDLVTKRPIILKKKTKSVKRNKNIGRTTIMLIIVSAIYTVSFIPYLGLTMIRLASPKLFDDMTNVQIAFYNLFIRISFINSAVNPIVYSLCDLNFRRECFALLKRLCRCGH